MRGENPFLGLEGAVSAGESGVASHYGEPLPEQRALATGDAIVDLSHHGVVIVSGEDRLSWLNSMTSQLLLGLEPGLSTETLLLDANGRIEHAIRVADDGERCWLLVDEASAEPLTAFLTRMRFALRVEVRDASREFATVLAFAGGSAQNALEALSPVLRWRDPWAAVSRGGVQYAVGDHAGAEWSATQYVFARSDLAGVAALVSSGVVRAAGLLALDALEVRAWRPSQRGDVDERAIPHEFDWLRTAVHLTKGCYRGQETIAKVHNLGHPPRRLALLHLDGSGGELPVPGALVYLAGAGDGAGAGAGDGAGAGVSARPVGRVTRSALHYEWGGIALALLKRSVPESADLEVRVGPGADDAGAAGAEGAEGAAVVAASQEVIVPADAGATVNIPRLKRL